MTIRPPRCTALPFALAVAVALATGVHAGPTAVNVSTGCGATCRAASCRGRYSLVGDDYACIPDGQGHLAWASCGAAKAASCALVTLRTNGTACGAAPTPDAVYNQSLLCGVCQPGADGSAAQGPDYWEVTCGLGGAAAVLRSGCDRGCRQCRQNGEALVPGTCRRPTGDGPPALTFRGGVVPCQAASFFSGPTCRVTATALQTPVTAGGPDAQCLLPEQLTVSCPPPPPTPPIPAGHLPSRDFSALFQPPAAYNVSLINAKLAAFFAPATVVVEQRAPPVDHDGRVLGLLRFTAGGSTPALRQAWYHTSAAALIAQFGIVELNGADPIAPSTPAPILGGVSKGKGWIAALVIFGMIIVVLFAVVVYRAIAPQQKFPSGGPRREAYHPGLESSMVNRSNASERASLVSEAH